MKIRAAGWVLIALIAAFVVLVIAAAAASRTEPLRKLVVATLSERLNSDVQLESFSVDPFPSVVIRGTGVVLRLHGAQAAHVPPLIEIKSFTVRCGIFDLFRRPRRFRQVALEGLVVNIPPGGLRTAGDAVESAGAGAAQGATSADLNREAPIVIDKLHSEGALLRIIPRRAGKQPRDFAIHSLEMESLGFAQPMPFRATLTNPLPKGDIAASGTFGPWRRDDPSTTPLAGSYTFAKADLATIQGIAGILDSTGQFSGELERIAVKGQTHTPDFNLQISGQKVPLDTTFETVVDGTDGDTYLNAVYATLGQTSLTAKGMVVRTEGVKGRTIKLDVKIHEGRIEDLLRLATKAKNPVLLGRVALRTDFLLPPGERDVYERLVMEGDFDLDSARFTDADVQKKLAGMSARARGIDPAEHRSGSVATEMAGRFRLRNGILTFSQLSFSLPGATVALHGTYGLRSEALAFDGTLRMQATISEAAGGGLKGFFLKIVDPLFRKKGAGAVIPIRIRGTVQEPKFGLDVGRVFKN